MVPVPFAGVVSATAVVPIPGMRVALGPVASSTAMGRMTAAMTATPVAAAVTTTMAAAVTAATTTTAADQNKVAAVVGRAARRRAAV